MWRAKYIGDAAIYRNTFVRVETRTEDCKRDGKYHKICLLDMEQYIIINQNHMQMCYEFQ